LLTHRHVSMIDLSCLFYVPMGLMTIVEGAIIPFDLLEGIDASSPKNWRGVPLHHSHKSQKYVK